MTTRDTGSTAGWSPGGSDPTEPARPMVTLPQPGNLLGGRFLLRRQLGAGGSGVVFAAHDEEVGQPVAVKVLLPHLVDASARERLRREVQAARLGHPNLVAVHDLHQADGLLFLSMELVDGVSLRDRLARGGPLAVDEAVTVIREVASALAHLHAAGIVHRDVKPGNVMLARDGRARLCDLGLARPACQGITVTASVLAVGTPAYMAPEQGLGDRLTPAADIYALGLTLYEALTGEIPHVGETPLATALNRQRGRPPRLRRSLPECPRWLDRLVDRMLERDPRRRPKAAEVGHALATGRVRPRPPWRALVAAAVSVAVVTAGAWGWHALRRGATVRVDTAGQVIRGVNSRDRTTWSFQLESPIRQVERADLDGDGEEDTLVATFPEMSAATADPELAMSEVLVVSSRGKVLTRVHPEELASTWRHPFPKRFVLSMGLSDLDGDGRPEVLVTARQRRFYPCELFVYWPAAAHWDWVLDHSGWLLLAVPVPGASPPELLFLALNNRLLMLPAAGTLRLQPPSGREPSIASQSPVVAPGDSYHTSRVASLERYTLLPPGFVSWSSTEDSVRVTLGRDGGARLAWGQESVDLDRFGNPVPGPNAGENLAVSRLDFLHEMEILQRQPPATSAARVRSLCGGIRRRFSTLLREPPYAAVLGVLHARALVRIGEVKEAVAVLEATAAHEPFEDVALRLAELQAVAGDRRRAMQVLVPLVEENVSSRSAYDGTHLLLRLAVEDRDPAGVRHWTEVLESQEANPERQAALTAALDARVRLWWDRPTAADAGIKSQSFAPEGAAVACLARWRLGRSGPDDVELMRAAIALWPDAEGEGRAALAAAQLGQGQPDDALATLDGLVAALEAPAREDFAAYQVLHLARALRACALVAVGRLPEARAEAEALLTSASPGLLPSNLAHEVLERTGLL